MVSSYRATTGKEPWHGRQIIKTVQTSRPKPKLVKLYEKQYKVFVGLYGSLKDDFARMAKLVQQ